MSQAVSDPRLMDAQRAVAEQKEYIRKMIMRGVPTQAAEDRLRRLQHELAALKGRQHG